MYRVELKDTSNGSSASLCILVPNVPCGVERLNSILFAKPLYVSS